MQVNFFPKKWTESIKKKLKQKKIQQNLTFTTKIIGCVERDYPSLQVSLFCLSDQFAFLWNDFFDFSIQIFVPASNIFINCQGGQKQKKPVAGFFCFKSKKLFERGCSGGRCIPPVSLVVRAWFFFYFSGAPLVQHKYSILASLFLLDFFGWLNKKKVFN